MKKNLMILAAVLLCNVVVAEENTVDGETKSPAVYTQEGANWEKLKSTVISTQLLDQRHRHQNPDKNQR